MAALGLGHLIDSDLSRPVRWSFAAGNVGQYVIAARRPFVRCPWKSFSWNLSGECWPLQRWRRWRRRHRAWVKVDYERNVKLSPTWTWSLSGQQLTCQLSSAHVCIRIRSESSSSFWTQQRHQPHACVHILAFRVFDGLAAIGDRITLSPIRQLGWCARSPLLPRYSTASATRLPPTYSLHSAPPHALTHRLLVRRSTEL